MISSHSLTQLNPISQLSHQRKEGDAQSRWLVWLQMHTVRVLALVTGILFVKKGEKSL